MNGLLLDTNALLWLLAGSKHLGAGARERLGGRATVYVSAVSIMEICIKEMLGKVHVPEPLAEAAPRAGLRELPFRQRHAVAMGQFSQLARHDPFDRMLLAQAHADDLVLLTSDGVLLGLGYDWVIDARG